MENKDKINRWYEKLYNLCKNDEEIMVAMQDFHYIKEKQLIKTIDKHIKNLW